MNRQQYQWSDHTIWDLIFYGNYFYGFCAVALSIEAALQQHFPLNGFVYFFLVFIAAVLYYNYPYARKYTVASDNPRTNWYIKHYSFVRCSQIVITIILSAALLIFLYYHGGEVLAMKPLHWLMALIFPFVAALYYGINFLSHRYNIRKVGWLKPFIIGFTWAGLVNVYPVLFYTIIHRQHYEPNFLMALLFVKNFMFVSVLCIMFDIKDYATDRTSHLKTFVVRMGLRKTIFSVLLPLSILGLATFIYYAVDHRFHTMKIVLNTIPFIALLLAAGSLKKRRSLMYYLVVIDGLMLVKAVCGSIAMLYF